jgi:GDP-L-fucose synthase
MNRHSKIYVAGHRGLVGSALMRRLQASGYTNIAVRTHAELDLTKQAEVEAFFNVEEPEYVFLAAARVGGIGANSAMPADFIMDNVSIELNAIRAAFAYGTKKLLFIASSSVYPLLAEIPIREDSMLTGKLEPSNEFYALAKIVGIKICEALNKQYGVNFISVTPTNLYGFNDKDDLQSSHVIPSLIRKFREAVAEGANTVTVWGSGNARREFLHADDLADACLFLMEHYNGDTPINIGCGSDISIRELAELIAEISSFKGNIVWDKSKPDGKKCNLLDSSKLFNLGIRPRISLKQGLADLYNNSHLKK